MPCWNSNLSSSPLVNGFTILERCFPSFQACTNWRSCCATAALSHSEVDESSERSSLQVWCFKVRAMKRFEVWMPFLMKSMRLNLCWWWCSQHHSRVPQQEFRPFAAQHNDRPQMLPTGSWTQSSKMVYKLTSDNKCPTCSLTSMEGRFQVLLSPNPFLSTPNPCHCQVVQVPFGCASSCAGWGNLGT